ncbi:MAG: hypothetical protein V1806_10155 [Pseudomonadota bacterium]
MSDEDLIAALNQAVKQEVLENYCRERRVIEEEGNLLFETCCAYQGGLSAWDKGKLLLARALLNPHGVERFFALAGLAPPQAQHQPADLAFPPPRGWTRCGRFQRLITRLYQELWQERQDLEKELQKALALRQEVNQDILEFERNHDFLSLSAYLRDLDPQELQRRKILGVNFSPGETAASAQALSFRPFSVERLGLDQPPEQPRPPQEVLPAAQEFIQDLCRQHPELVDSLWA